MITLLVVRLLILVVGSALCYYYGKADRKEVWGVFLIGVVVFISGLYLVYASIFRPDDGLTLPLIMAVVEGGALLIGYLIKQLRRR